LVLAGAVLASLGSASQPSINAAAKSDLDRRLLAIQPSERSVPAPTIGEPLPITPGQWVTLKETDKDGHPTLATYKILAMQDGAYWYEVSTDSYYGHTAAKMLLFIGDRTSVASFEVRAMIMKDHDGRVTEVPPPTLSLMRSSWESLADQLVVQWNNLPQEDVRVLAGTFAGCYKGRSTVEFAGYSATSDVWYHPAVPLSGTVKSVGIDRPSTVELVDFGFEGASSEL